MKASTFISAAAALALSSSFALAAPCNTGTTKDKNPGQQAANPKSSDVDTSSKNLAGGEQPASPGTVGAMNNVGANQAAGANTGSTAQANKGDRTDPGAKNLAGGEQPASPGTVGAMNNAGADQKVGKKDDDC
ncbi:exopolysaccharide production protein YjbE [Methylobacterium durans]|uniref:Exopolysaccharide production protein YjbE n=1 Tax=Methylobacterium durans TaxID=2202825 RepID=A0A2U8WAY7_9HYPH|nr:exopolysaccharide production protein YjbE [Methylobacterium durans]AWN43199.1 exopolysaccharide production protein YjbE [Methylobacterium durans]AWN43206.1 exopolysaccharide production protein YjbE [Methylobacterium durans]